MCVSMFRDEVDLGKFLSASAGASGCVMRSFLEMCGAQAVRDFFICAPTAIAVRCTAAMSAGGELGSSGIDVHGRAINAARRGASIIVIGSVDFVPVAGP